MTGDEEEGEEPEWQVAVSEVIVLLRQPSPPAPQVLAQQLASRLYPASVAWERKRLTSVGKPA